MFTAEERRKYIGGSDIATVLGMSRWNTPLKLWLEKIGEAEPTDLSTNEAVQLGTELEDFVAKKFAKATGKQVRKQSKMYVHKDYPFMVAHVDRLITGTNELLECKTCSAFKKDEWENDEIPKEYVLQVIWYLGITGREKAYIAVLIGGQSFKYKEIEFDAELFEVMVQVAKEFWNCVETKTPPAVAPNDNPILAKVFPNHNEELIENSELDGQVAKLQQIKSDISVLEEEQKMIEAELKGIIGTNLGIITPNYKVTWKEQKENRVSAEKLKNAGLYEEYTVSSSKRVLRVTQNKVAA